MYALLCAVRHAAARPTSPTLTAAYRTVWQYDARYWRVEPVDAEGRSLGIVYFELRRSAATGLRRAA